MTKYGVLYLELAWLVKFLHQDSLPDAAETAFIPHQNDHTNIFRLPQTAELSQMTVSMVLICEWEDEMPHCASFINSFS